ncbi:MAG: hypothetical protein K6U74_01390 [Firmicutes bacterium]|nr:hypothetical protein [Bacillota bacterium]
MAKAEALKTVLEKAVKGKLKTYKVPEKKAPKSQILNEPIRTYWPPELYLSDKDFPGIEKWKGGDTVTLVITAMVRSHSVNEYDDGKGNKKTYNASLEVTSISDITPVGGGKK